MNRTCAGAILLVTILAAALPARSQTPSPAALPPPPGTSASQRPPDAQSPSRAQADGSRDADARHCLDLATNNEIIACAEKYRSHRARK